MVLELRSIGKNGKEEVIETVNMSEGNRVPDKYIFNVKFTARRALTVIFLKREDVNVLFVIGGNLAKRTLAATIDDIFDHDALKELVG